MKTLKKLKKAKKLVNKSKSRDQAELNDALNQAQIYLSKAIKLMKKEQIKSIDGYKIIKKPSMPDFSKKSIKKLVENS